MKTRFHSDIQVRPSDIDINGHVHNSIYLDYVSQARMEQMEKFYHYSMKKFWEQALTWVVKNIEIDFIRPIKLENQIQVFTWLESFEKSGCQIGFEIILAENNKIAAKGYIRYTLIKISSGRAVALPDDVIKAYSI
jgi:YbgC/YbaW family acyl-CoA thioester hydrolase